MSSKLTEPPTTASITSGISAKTFSSLPHRANSRSTTLTRCTCSLRQLLMPCSKHSKSLRSTLKFIFATTEPNKILPTIISRCQRFDLRPIPTETIAKHLQYISTQEGVQLDDPAAWAIAKGADGGMRDAQSMLDQLVAFCGESITEQNVLEIFGFTSRETVASLTSSILPKIARKRSS